jgi:NitT/TauT family transport system permease protein
MAGMNGWWRRLAGWAAPLLTVAAFLLVWSLYVRRAGVSPFVLPAPEAIAAALVELVQERGFASHVWITLFETLSGFGIATCVGIALGTALAKSPALESALKPLIVTLQVVPKVALVPLLILWFGFGPESKIVISAVLAFFPIFSNTLLGMKSVDRGQVELFQVLGARPVHRFWLLELPSAGPYILTGMEVGIVLAIIGAIVGEFVGGNVGLGFLAVAKLQELKVAALFAVIAVLALIGLSLYALIGLARRMLIPWHAAVHPGAPMRPRDGASEAS